MTVFYFNPCITEPEEYERRKAAQIQFLQEYNKGLEPEEQVGFIEGDYEPESFLDRILKKIVWHFSGIYKNIVTFV